MKGFTFLTRVSSKNLSLENLNLVALIRFFRVPAFQMGPYSSTSVCYLYLKGFKLFLNTNASSKHVACSGFYISLLLLSFRGSSYLDIAFCHL